MSILVLKFGGTSLRDEKSREAAVKHIKKAKDEGNQVVVVVSAMGRAGEPYATDSLISLLKNINEKINPKKKDLIMSCGEIISSAVISHLLDTKGMASEALAGFQAGIHTDNNFNNSEIEYIDTKKIVKHLDNGKIVVVAGFQGITEDMEITTLGRGGSDTSAVVLGGYLKAKRVDIFTDVPGVAVVDPRIVSDAHYLKSISYKDMYKLALNGAKVIHPRAVLAAEKFKIPVVVRSTFTADSGTLISNYSDSETNIIGITSDKNMIRMFFNPMYLDTIKINLENHISIIKDIPFQIQWNDDNVAIIVEKETIKFIKLLYEFYVKFNLNLARV